MSASAFECLFNYEIIKQFTTANSGQLSVLIKGFKYDTSFNRWSGLLCGPTSWNFRLSSSIIV
ncbi:hypothetical protein FJMB80055_16600 [Enterobacter hormaechei]|nr:hypothetical protein FJMB80008_24870 [Enterobacter hormaechei]GJJ96449.1 hypothetical protein TUM16654_47330 [Enterobacter cloacae]BDJ32470.1 hypothetical protein FJMB80017_24620 [Enterobacter hormaechei]BDJ37521.1 hypothetical protein FJMB80019_24880 [Enterobacter hormaechei]BDJ91346.1 hypothetical protein FJMB80067_25490 [Enterobacter hormaechei]